MNNLAGKVAIVSGSGRGIGRAIALKLARHGAKLVVNDLDDAPGDAVAAEIRALGGEAVAVNGDVTEPGFADRFVGAAIDKLGGLDIIVNNAGYTWDCDDPENDRRAISGDARRASRGAVPHSARGGRADPDAFAKQDAEAGREVFRKVVNISSIAGLYGNAGQASYSSAKASLIGLTRTMCKEWGRYKVNVNCVAFGLIQHAADASRSRRRQATIDVAGARNQGRTSSRSSSSDGAPDSARPRRHAGRGGRRRLSLLHAGIELHQRPGSSPAAAGS